MSDIIDHEIRPRNPAKLVISFFSETLWHLPHVQKSVENVSIYQHLYGIVHSHVEKVIATFIKNLPQHPKLKHFAVDTSAPPFYYPNSLFDDPLTEGIAYCLNTELKRLFGICGMRANASLCETPNTTVKKQKKQPIPGLPVLPFLLYTLAKKSDIALSKVDPNFVASLLAKDLSLPAWIDENCSPKRCERHSRRFHQAIKLVKTGRAERFDLAGGRLSLAAMQYPEIAIMYPQPFRMMGVKLLDHKYVKRYTRILPEAILAMYLKKDGYWDVRPTVPITLLSALATKQDIKTQPGDLIKVCIPEYAKICSTSKL